MCVCDLITDTNFFHIILGTCFTALLFLLLSHGQMAGNQTRTSNFLSLTFSPLHFFLCISFILLHLTFPNLTLPHFTLIYVALLSLNFLYLALPCLSFFDYNRTFLEASRLSKVSSTLECNCSPLKCNLILEINLTKLE